MVVAELLGFGEDEFQTVCLQSALDLIASVNCPWAGGVQFDVGTPVSDGSAWFSKLLVGKREVVVRVCIGRRELQSGLVGLNRFLHPTSFVEHVAQIEIREGVARIDFDGAAVMSFGLRVLLAVVVQRS